ncbi:class I SAM-dependent methyltransferase [Algoriphagus sp. Y33]|uniref:class I SAM-dependent methyltransferase n=1 Tax=Algoriphagus sp. Y33 TaxID=2772483 RepID=UPI001CE1F559|nr:class I SAM-dependent methyltransferase [Algoriphagus sp. Y33]
MIEKMKDHVHKTEKKIIPALGYDFLTAWYDATIRITMPERKFRNLLVDHLNPANGEHILEFGFGTAANLLIAAKKAPNSHFTGLDIDPKIREIAKHKLTKNSLSITLNLYDGTTFPFESNSFDKVVSCLVFHHLDKEAKLRSLKEIHRVLKPGGKLVIGDWGQAKSRMMRMAFYLVQVLDGFKTTNDNVKGLLPEYIQESGFSDVQEVDHINTKIGSFCYYVGDK